MSSFIELDTELDGLDNTSMNLSLSYCISINMMHVYTNNLNNTNNSVNETCFFSNCSQKKLNAKFLVQVIMMMFAIFWSCIKVEAMYVV